MVHCKISLQWRGLGTPPILDQYRSALRQLLGWQLLIAPLGAYPAHRAPEKSLCNFLAGDSDSHVVYLGVVRQDLGEKNYCAEHFNYNLSGAP